MNNYYVIVTDAARARFFALNDAVTANAGLVEQGDMANTEAEAAGKELWSSKSGRNTAPMGAGAHGYDDHRDQHQAETKRRFAKQIADAAIAAADWQHARHVVLVAEKQMLGHLREALDVPPKAKFDVREIAKDLTKLAPHDLHEYLATEHALPPRVRDI